MCVHSFILIFYVLLLSFYNVLHFLLIKVRLWFLLNILLGTYILLIFYLVIVGVWNLLDFHVDLIFNKCARFSNSNSLQIPSHLYLQKMILSLYFKYLYLISFLHIIIQTGSQVQCLKIITGILIYFLILMGMLSLLSLINACYRFNNHSLAF